MICGKRLYLSQNVDVKISANVTDTHHFYDALIISLRNPLWSSSFWNISLTESCYIIQLFLIRYFDQLSRNSNRVCCFHVTNYQLKRTISIYWRQNIRRDMSVYACACMLICVILYRSALTIMCTTTCSKNIAKYDSFNIEINQFCVETYIPMIRTFQNYTF